jgi:solute carrier family 35 protein F1/2
MLPSLANAAEEFLVRRSPLYEVVGQIGMWGTLTIGIQAAVLEHKAVREVPWNGPIGTFFFHPSVTSWVDRDFGAGFLMAYTTAMFIFYTMTPIVYRLASSVFYNLSLLSANFFGLLFGERTMVLIAIQSLIGISGLFLFVRLVCMYKSLTRVNCNPNMQHYRPFWLYFVAFPVIIAGLVCYFWSTTHVSEILMSFFRTETETVF